MDTRSSATEQGFEAPGGGLPRHSAEVPSPSLRVSSLTHRCRIALTLFVCWYVTLRLLAGGEVRTTVELAPVNQHNRDSDFAAARNDEDPWWLSSLNNMSNCRSVFLDVGANRGRQLDKLYEGTAPNSPWSKKFASLFGSSVQQRRQEVCSIAIEPDRVHHPELAAKITTWQHEQRIAVQFLQAAAWVVDGAMTLHSVWSPHTNHDASTITPEGLSVIVVVGRDSPRSASYQGDGQNSPRAPVLRRVLAKNVARQQANVTTYQVRTVRLASLISEIAHRVPMDAVIAVKLDVEGAEHRILADLVLSPGAPICTVDYYGVEVHDHLATSDQHPFSRNLTLLHELIDAAGSSSSPRRIQTHRCRRGRTRIEAMDDET